jgi:hypothetical protein
VNTSRCGRLSAPAFCLLLASPLFAAPFFGKADVSPYFGKRTFPATAFTGYREFRSLLLSTTWNFGSGALEELIKASIDRALFQMTWGPGAWRLFPGSIPLSSLIRLADPVVARINTELTD